MKEEKVTVKQILRIIIIAICVYWGLNNLSLIWNIVSKIIGIISPFILGACLAFILNIPMTFFEKKISKLKNKKGKPAVGKGLAKIISLCLAIVVIIFIISLIFKLIVPELINIIGLLIENIPYYAEELGKITQDLTKDMPDIQTIIEDMNIDVEQIKSQAISLASSFLSSSISFIGNILTSVVNFVVAVIFAVYILMGKQKLKEQVKKLLYAYLKKEKADKVIEVGRISRNTFKKFITGQCTEATILGVLCILGMIILRIPYAVPIGVLIGVTALIPVVGAFLGAIVGAILIVSVAPIKVITFIIFIIVLQQVEGNLIYPKVMSNSIGMPGIWVLVAVTIGGSLFGVIGMLIGVPISSIIYTVLKLDANKRIKKENI